jgi:DNA repair protein RadC
MFHGTIDGAEAHPREVVKSALRHNAAAVIFSHNHPSGNPEPSAADRALTKGLNQTLALIDARTLDHVIVAGQQTAAFAEHRWL